MFFARISFDIFSFRSIFGFHGTFYQPDIGRYQIYVKASGHPFRILPLVTRRDPLAGGSLMTYAHISALPLSFFMSAATYSPTFAVPSAVSVLTVVFGMGTGVSPIRIATDNDADHFVIRS